VTRAVDFRVREGLPQFFTGHSVEDIFHHSNHLKLQAADGWNSFSMVDEEQQVVAAMHFHIGAGMARNPYRAPYGSFYFSEKLTDDQLNEFIFSIGMQLESRGVTQIHIKTPPAAYPYVKSDGLCRALKQAGYRVDADEISAIIFVKHDPFNSILHASERKRLRKCEEADFTFHLLPLDQLEEVYNFLKVHRQKKDYALSMSFEDLKRTVEVFPDRFVLSIIRDGQKWAAANISVIVNPEVLYNFYHDHDEVYNQYSPVVMLVGGLYRFCQENGIKLLDLGTSQTGNKVNQSLLDFKLRLGARPSPKLTFVRNIR
jgi:lipid II:glycine glycyltransferase (peptidoglycan interpeptide bridge formation enzyme)